MAHDISKDVERSGAGVEGRTALARFAALLMDARRHRATDIHLEPAAGDSSLRYRVDGALRDMVAPPGLALEQILPLVKSLCNIKTGEHQNPGDGHGSISHAGHRMEFNAATFPTLNGERLTIHMQPDPIESLSLDHLRLAPAECVQIQTLTDLTHGVIISAGPQDAEKTMLLYAMLLHMDRKGRSVMTIEDPVFAPIPGISQTAVQPATGLTWPRALNHVLRQDPDVLALTAPARHRAFPTVFSAAQQGRLIFLQLTTGSGAQTLRHLLDSGLPPYQITESLQAVVAQRSVRVLCPECKARHTPDLGSFSTSVAAYISALPHASFFTAVGCARCRQTGYESILPMLEVLVMNNELRDLVAGNPPLGQLRVATSIEGLPPLLHNAILKASIGLISLDEVKRVLPGNSL